LSAPAEDRAGTDGSRVAIGRTLAGRFLAAVVEDEAPASSDLMMPIPIELVPAVREGQLEFAWTICVRLRVVIPIGIDPISHARTGRRRFA
jgi:hypothetical protein